MAEKDQSTVAYLEEHQLDYIEQIESLLERARDGQSIGCTIIEFAADGSLVSEQLGTAPDDRSLIGELGACSADLCANLAVESVFEMLDEIE